MSQSQFADSISRENLQSLRGIAAPATWSQLGILVLDGSISMNETSSMGGERRGSVTKAQGVDAAVRSLVRRLRDSRSRNNFHLALISYNDRVTHVEQPRPVVAIDDSEDFDPTAHGTGGTRLTLGLQEAKRVADAFLATPSELVRSVVVVALSDGEDENPAGVQAAASAFGESATICTAHLSTGTPSPGETLLRSIATDPVRNFTVVQTAEELRDFFMKSVTAAPQAGQAGLEVE
jgi:hypothetical protein